MKKLKNYRKRRACFNCVAEIHLVRGCPHPVKYPKAAANLICKLKGCKNRCAVHIVLAHLCNVLDLDDEEHSISFKHSDSKVFESILINAEQLSKKYEKDLNHVEILSVDAELIDHDNRTILGACFDPCAKLKVVGNGQEDAYRKLTGFNCDIKRIEKGTVFRYGSVDYKGIGELNIRLPLCDDHFIHITAHNVPIDVPLLLGLDVMQELELVVDFYCGTI